MQIIWIKSDLFSFFMFSYILPLGISLENDQVMGIIYLLLMGYMFIGIGIVSDIFMEAIEVITA